MTEGGILGVEEVGAPRLVGASAVVPGQETADELLPPLPQPPGAPGALEGDWTPEEASHLLAGVFNIGVVFYGPEWAVKPDRVAGWDQNAANLCNRFLPKSQGAILAIDCLMVGQGLAGMVGERRELLQRGPRALWEHEPAGPPRDAVNQYGQVPTPAPQPQLHVVPPSGDDRPAPTPPPPSGGGTYKLPADLGDFMARVRGA